MVFLKLKLSWVTCVFSLFGVSNSCCYNVIPPKLTLLGPQSPGGGSSSLIHHGAGYHVQLTLTCFLFAPCIVWAPLTHSMQ